MQYVRASPNGIKQSPGVQNAPLVNFPNLVPPVARFAMKSHQRQQWTARVQMMRLQQLAGRVSGCKMVDVWYVMPYPTRK
jgi:hypothetical protein